MKRTALLLLALTGLALAACAPRAPDPDRFAAKFFEHGKESIIDAMKDQEVGKSQLAAARGILDRYQPEAQRDLAAAMRAGMRPACRNAFTSAMCRGWGASRCSRRAASAGAGWLGRLRAFRC